METRMSSKTHVRPQTVHTGADLERQAWMAKLKRLRSDPFYSAATIDIMLSWGAGRAKRAKERKGGI